MRDLRELTDEINGLAESLQAALAEMRADATKLDPSTAESAAAHAATAQIEKAMAVLEKQAQELTITLRMLALKTAELHMLAYGERRDMS